MALGDRLQTVSVKRIRSAAEREERREPDLSGSALPRETIIIDQRIAIIAGGRTPAGREYTVTTSPALVAGVHDLF